MSLFDCSLMQPDEKQTRQRDMLLLLTSGEMWVGNFLGHEIDSSHFGRAQLFWWASSLATRIGLTMQHWAAQSKSTTTSGLRRYSCRNQATDTRCSHSATLTSQRPAAIPTTSARTTTLEPRASRPEELTATDAGLWPTSCVRFKAKKA